MNTTTQLSPLKLLTLGYSVIPSGGGESGKAPLIDWKPYQDTTPTDDNLESWENTYHPLLWGIITGPAAGVFVIDCDGSDALPLFGNLKPHVKTPRGYHFYFKYPGTGDIQTKAGLLPHIDVRGRGGFVNVTGMRRDGCKYEVLIVPTQDNLYSLDQLPPRIKAALSSNGQTKSPTIKKNVPVGERNSYLTSLAGTMQRRGMSKSAIKAALIEESNTWDSPLDEHEIATIATSVGRYPPAPEHPKPQSWRDRLVTHDQLINKDIPEIEFAVDGLFPRPGLCVLAGKKKLGKSFMGSQLAQCKAAGTPFLDLITPAGSVLYLALEDGERRLKQRLAMQHTVAGLPISYLYSILPLNTPAGYTEFRDMILELRPSLNIIDTFKAAVNGKLDENEAGTPAELFNKLHELAIEANTTIIIIMHHGKPKMFSQERDAGFDIRGTSALPGATDCNVSLYKNPDGTYDLLAEGRDIAEKEIRLEFDREKTWTWINKGDAKDVRRNESEQRILEAIFSLGDEVDAGQIAAELALTQPTIQVQVKRMRENGLLDWKSIKNGRTTKIVYSLKNKDSK